MQFQLYIVIILLLVMMLRIKCIMINKSYLRRSLNSMVSSLNMNLMNININNNDVITNNMIIKENSQQNLPDETKIILKNELELLHTKEKKLYDDLKKWRKEISDIEGTPIYSVCKNEVFESSIRQLPTKLDELKILSGVGPIVLEKRGIDILNIVKPHIQSIMESRNLLKLQGTMNNEIQQIMSDVSVPSWWIDKPKQKRELETERKPRTKKTKEISENILIELRENNSFEAEQLTSSQRTIAEQILNTTNNVFLTGSAGTGKSYLLKYLIHKFQETYDEGCVAVTAPTGVAAVNIGGQTIHSFAGIGLGTGSHESIINKVKKSTKHIKRWKNTKILIIDEISMMDSSLFELIDNIGRVTCGQNNLPFGGIRIIVVGDFMQLPPVPQKGARDRNFCFESPIWEESKLKENTIYLADVIRQTNAEFVGLLNEVRIGQLSSKSSKLLDLCLINKKSRPDDDIVPTKLYCTNKDVDSENESRLDELSGEMVTVTATDFWKYRSSQAYQNQNVLDMMTKLVPKAINLKVGAQVMLLRNRIQYQGKVSNLVNGSRGVIKSFVSIDGEEIPVVKFDNGLQIPITKVPYERVGVDGESVLIRNQVPLKLAWAVTVHKSQGSTLSRAELLLDNAFDYGQVYVALSRVQSLDGLWLQKSITNSAIKANPKAIKYYNEINSSQNFQ